MLFLYKGIDYGLYYFKYVLCVCMLWCVSCLFWLGLPGRRDIAYQWDLPGQLSKKENNNKKINIDRDVQQLPCNFIIEIALKMNHYIKGKISISEVTKLRASLFVEHNVQVIHIRSFHSSG